MKIPKNAKVAVVPFSELVARPLVATPIKDNDRKVIQSYFDEAGFDMEKPIGNAGYDIRTDPHVFYQE